MVHFTPQAVNDTESKSRQQTQYDDTKRKQKGKKKAINKEFHEVHTGEGKQEKGVWYGRLLFTVKMSPL